MFGDVVAICTMVLGVGGMSSERCFEEVMN